MNKLTTGSGVPVVSLTTSNPDPILTLQPADGRSSVLIIDPNSQKLLTIRELASDIFDKLKDFLFTSRSSIISSIPDLYPANKQESSIDSSVPTLYTTNKTEMLKSHEYYYNFLNSPRKKINDDNNPAIKFTKEKLDNALKTKISETIEFRTLKIFKKLVPDINQLKDNETKEEEIKQFISDTQEFQINYQQTVAEIQTELEKFWSSIVADEDKRNKLKKLFKDVLEKFPNSFDKGMERFRKALFSEEVLSWIDNSGPDGSIEKRKKRALEVGKTIENFFKGSPSPLQLKQKKLDRLQTLYAELKSKHPVNEKLLQKSLALESAAVTNFLEGLIHEHQAHTFGRFTKLFTCHADFINNLIYLFNNMKLKTIEPATIQKIVIDILSRTHLDSAEDPESTNDVNFYRLIQGRPKSEDTEQTNKDKLFNEKMRSVFSRAIRSLFIKREKSHTIPFPGAFSWKMEKLKDKFAEQSITVSSKITENRITSEAFEKFKEGKLDQAKLIQKVIDQLKGEPTEAEFIREALLVIMQWTLIHASETEHMPHFINNRLDQLSEVRLKEEAFVQASAKKSTSSSSEEIEHDYKKLLGQNLVKLIQANKDVDFAAVFKAHHSYIKQILERLNFQIEELTNKKSVQTISVEDLYELRLICDIWAAIEHAERRAGYSISSSIEPKWNYLNEWLEAKAEEVNSTSAVEKEKNPDSTSAVGQEQAPDSAEEETKEETFDLFG